VTHPHSGTHPRGGTHPRSGTHVYSETSGNGPPLLLLHGWGTNLRVFDALRAGLAERYTVTALDLPGHGLSAWNEGSAEQQLAWIAAQVPPQAILVGWSLGGQLALQLAANASLRVRALVLIASTPRFVLGEDWPHGLAPGVLQEFASRLERDPRGTVADFLELQVRGSAELQRELSAHGIAQPAALAAGLAQLQHNDLRELARALDIPTLIIAGQYDRITPPQAAQALQAMLPQGRLLSLGRAGHAPFLSHQAQVLAALFALPEHAAP
jgi:pimeloyl-[acyl-carrier protein] methyl ester esterase